MVMDTVMSILGFLLFLITLLGPACLLITIYWLIKEAVKNGIKEANNTNNNLE